MNALMLPRLFAGAAVLGSCGLASSAFAVEPKLEIVDCPALSPTVTRELLAIELGTLGVVPGSAMLWTVRCHGQRATLTLHEALDGQPDRLAAVELDLSSTDEAAWPRLVAISASELVGQSRQAPRNPSPTEPPKRGLMPRVTRVSFDVQTQSRTSFLPSLGFVASRLGDPGTWLMGLGLGTELRFGGVLLAGADLRSQWGSTEMAPADVAWQLVSVGAFGGAATNLGLVEVSATGGLRVGRLTLSGKATSSEFSGRDLTGATGGPFAAFRARRSLGKSAFVGVFFEAGYSFWPVRGSNDAVAPLVTVDGVWTTTGVSVGCGF
jgi:hypothetical protein